MKKLFIGLSLIVMAFSSCNDKGNVTPPPLVTDPVLPPATEEFTPGQNITINGNGFTAADEIWLRVPAKAETRDIQTTVTAQSATQITFTIPEGVTPGEYTVVLKRSGTEMPMGTINVGEPQPTAEAKFYCLGEDGIYTIDPQSHALNQLIGANDYNFSGRNVYDASKNTIYSVEWDEMLVSDEEGEKYITRSWLGIIDLTANSYTRLDLPNGIDFYIYLIAGQPTLLAQPTASDDHLRLYNIDLTTGALTESLDLGAWKSTFGVSGDYSFYIWGTYLKGQSLYMAVSVTNEQTDQAEFRYLALDLSTPAIIPGGTIQNDDLDCDIYFFERQGQLYTCIVLYNWSTPDVSYTSRIQLFDTDNLTASETCCTLENIDCCAPQYDATNDRLYWVTDWEKSDEGSDNVSTGTDWYTFDFATQTASKVYTWNETIWDLLLVY